MNPRWRSAPHLRLHLALLGLSLLLATLFAVYGWLDRQQLLRQAHEDAQFAARQTALTIEGSLDAIRLQLQSMQGLVELARTPPGMAPATVHRLLQDWRQGNANLMDLLILDSQGTIQHWSGSGPPPQVQDRDYFRIHQQPNPPALYIGLPQLSRVHIDRWFFALSAGMHDSDGQLQQVVVAIVDLNRLHQRLLLQPNRRHAQQALSNQERVLFLRSEDQTHWVGKQLPLPVEASNFAPGTPSGSFEADSVIDGQRKIIAFQSLGDFPLYASASLPVSEVLRPWYERLWIVLGLWLLISLALFAFGQRLARAMRWQEQLATTDSLTGLPNRRAILAQAQRLLRDTAQQHRCGLLMIDVDHFKSFNDTYGHALGDEVLRLVATTLAQQCRSSDQVGRVGGEEFVLLLPDTPPEGCRQVAESLRTTVEALHLPQGRLTISIGLTVLHGPEDTLERALARADAALYAAKSGGRNCVREAELHG